MSARWFVAALVGVAFSLNLASESGALKPPKRRRKLDPVTQMKGTVWFEQAGAYESALGQVAQMATEIDPYLSKHLTTILAKRSAGAGVDFDLTHALGRALGRAAPEVRAQFSDMMNEWIAGWAYRTGSDTLAIALAEKTLTNFYLSAGGSGDRYLDSVYHDYLGLKDPGTMRAASEMGTLRSLATANVFREMNLIPGAWDDGWIMRHLFEYCREDLEKKRDPRWCNLAVVVSWTYGREPGILQDHQDVVLGACEGAKTLGVVAIGEAMADNPDGLLAFTKQHKKPHEKGGPVDRFQTALHFYTAVAWGEKMSADQKEDDQMIRALNDAWVEALLHFGDVRQLELESRACRVPLSPRGFERIAAHLFPNNAARLGNLHTQLNSCLSSNLFVDGIAGDNRFNKTSTTTLPGMRDIPEERWLLLVAHALQDLGYSYPRGDVLKAVAYFGDVVATRLRVNTASDLRREARDALVLLLTLEVGPEAARHLVNTWIEKKEDDAWACRDHCPIYLKVHTNCPVRVEGGVATTLANGFPLSCSGVSASECILFLLPRGETYTVKVHTSSGWQTRVVEPIAGQSGIRATFERCN